MFGSGGIVLMTRVKSDERFVQNHTRHSLISSDFCLQDVDECSLQTHTCWNDSVCVNLPGGYDCVCTSGPGCSGDCPQEDGIRRNGEDWKPSFDRCAICSCKVQKTDTH